MISKLSLLFVLLALGAFPLCAQGDDNAAPGRYFRTVGAGVTTNDLYFSLKGKDKNISITDGYRSLLYSGKGTGKLLFYKIVPGPDGKPMHVNVAQADITKAGTLALLTFSADPNIPGDYDVEVLPDDLVTFPLGSYRIVNRSAIPVKFILGEQSTEVGPGENRLVIYPPPPKDACIPAKVCTSGASPLRLLYADTWAYNAKYRTEVLVGPRPGTTQSISISRMLDNPSVLLSKQYLPKD